MNYESGRKGELLITAVQAKLQCIYKPDRGTNFIDNLPAVEFGFSAQLSGLLCNLGCPL